MTDKKMAYLLHRFANRVESGDFVVIKTVTERMDEPLPIYHLEIEYIDRRKERSEE